MTDEDTVGNIPDAVQGDETTVQQEIVWFDDKLGVETQYGVIRISTKKRQVRLEGKLI